MGSETRFNHMAAQFAVDDVSRAIGFYAAALGFELDYLDGDPIRYAVVFRDEVYIHLSRAQPPEFVPGGGRAFVAVAGVNEIWERVLREAPDSITHPLGDIDYGHGINFRVFAISDPDGNSLRIGEPLRDG
jgi:predicted enzyme related to lactoylglutathione lyase